MTTTDLLGLPREEALRRQREAGGDAPEIVWTRDPRQSREARPGQDARPGREAGTPRVLRIRGNEWTVSGFLDADPKEEA